MYVHNMSIVSNYNFQCKYLKPLNIKWDLKKLIKFSHILQLLYYQQKIKLFDIIRHLTNLFTVMRDCRGFFFGWTTFFFNINMH